jgi:phage shock protein A
MTFDPAQLASLPRKAQMTALRSKLLALKREMDKCDRQIDRIEERHEALVAERNMVRAEIARLENLEN